MHDSMQGMPSQCHGNARQCPAGCDSLPVTLSTMKILCASEAMMTLMPLKNRSDLWATTGGKGHDP